VPLGSPKLTLVAPLVTHISKRQITKAQYFLAIECCVKETKLCKWVTSQSWLLLILNSNSQLYLQFQPESIEIYNVWKLHCICPGSCLALMSECKGAVHARHCHWHAPNAAFTAKAVAWSPLRKQAEMGAADHSRSCRFEMSTTTKYKRTFSFHAVLHVWSLATFCMFY